MRKTLLFILLMAAMLVSAADITSPDGKLRITVNTTDQQLTWAVATADGTAVLLPSPIALNVGGKDITAGKRSSGKARMVDTSFATPVYHSSTVRDRYASLTVSCGAGAKVEFRAYDDAAAYRIIVPGSRSKTLTVDSETAEFRFDADYSALIPYVNDLRDGEPYTFSFEAYYDEQNLSQMYADSLAISPLCVSLPAGRRAVILDGGVTDYPGMMLRKGKAPNSLEAVFAPCPTGERVNGLNLIPTGRAQYIARVSGGQQLPWRAVVVSENDAQLLASDIAMRLAPEQRIEDTSWIKPGKVAWDWWNNCNLSGVSFRAGMNTDTYKYYIDFAAKNHLEYIIIDEGWSSRESLVDNLNADIDVPALVAYGAARGVGLILWSSWRNMTGGDTADGTEAMERNMKHYADMGVKGFKVDFFDRDDQPTMASATRMAALAARHHLLLDLHGARPNGLNRMYPNVLNFEGVKGMENSKWEPRDERGPVHDQPRYDVTIPFLRMLAGPLDYTPGAMMNATRDNFFGSYAHPMSQGTRAHQVAMYTVFDAPLQMLADSPVSYEREQETTDFIAQIPTVFDETVAVAGEIGKYVVLARRKGETWYLAAMNDWTARDLELNLDFFDGSVRYAEVFADGVNADREARDYVHYTQSMRGGETISIHLAPGGGWSAILR